MSRSVRFDETTLTFLYSEITKPLIDSFVFPRPCPVTPSTPQVVPISVSPVSSQPDPATAAPISNLNPNFPETTPPDHTFSPSLVSPPSSLSTTPQPLVSFKSPISPSLPPPRRSERPRRQNVQLDGYDLFVSPSRLRYLLSH